MIYEALLIFGVLFIADLAFEALTQHRNAAALGHLRQLWLFVILGTYFVFFWRRGGQTLAMKTWRLKLIAPGAAQVSLKQAIYRYILSWMWFLPALALGYAIPTNNWTRVGLIAAGLIGWAATARWSSDRQFLHDRWAGTALVNVEKVATSPVAGK